MIVLERSEVIRSFGLLMGGRPCDRVFWRFLTAMTVLVLQSHGQGKVMVGRRREFRCKDLALVR